MSLRSKVGVPHVERIGGETVNYGSKEGLQRAREIISFLTDQQKMALLEEISGELAEREKTDPEDSTSWDYQRQPWDRGWIQRERKVRSRNDGPQKVYAYWSFHYIEDGRRKSEHIGSDEKLEHWKQVNPGG